jgi:hypothetical protein
MEPTEIDELNVSQDALLRAQVKGWFMGDLLSTRDAKEVDTDGDGVADIVLPEGRWVLPDDWGRLAGGKLAMLLRPHWDIMDQPNDNIMTDPDGAREWEEIYGPYPVWHWEIVWEAEGRDYGCFVAYEDVGNGVLDIEDEIAEWPVIGPYSSLDNYGNYPSYWAELDRKTIVPNGEINSWDAPMPPAKIIFEIAGAGDIGFFKAVDKADVYYRLIDFDDIDDRNDPEPNTIVYTNPYYAELIPGNFFISPFNNNVGYDWDSFDWTEFYGGWMGEYEFWTIINQIPYGDGAVTPDDALHGTMVEVFSDNHGEAMVWLNGAWNLNPTDVQVADWTERTSAGETVVVGGSTVVAIADYPFGRLDLPLVSNNVTKSWTWGKEKIVEVFSAPDSTQNDLLDPQKRVIVWLTNIDGLPAVGETVDLWIDGAAGADILRYLDADGNWVDCPGDTHAVTLTSRLPILQDTKDTTNDQVADASEVEAYWDSTLHGSNSTCNHAIVGIEVEGAAGSAVLKIDITGPDGVLHHTQPLNFQSKDQKDPELNAGLSGGLYLGPTQSVVTATGTIASYLEAIWWQDSNGVWHAYQPGAPAWANDLSAIEHGNVYWVNVNQNCFWNWELD